MAGVVDDMCVTKAGAYRGIDWCMCRQDGRDVAYFRKTVHPSYAEDGVWVGFDMYGCASRPESMIDDFIGSDRRMK